MEVPGVSQLLSYKEISLVLSLTEYQIPFTKGLLALVVDGPQISL